MRIEEENKMTQREPKKLGLAKILDVAFVPSSFIRFTVQVHKHFEEARPIMNTELGGIPPLITTTKAIGYIGAICAELMRLSLYYRFVEFLYKTVSSQT